MCHRWHMSSTAAAQKPRRRASRKTDAERGPLGAWLYNAAVLLDLSAEDIAEAVGTSSPTIRKVMGGSNRQPGRRLLWDINAFMEAKSQERGRPVERAPGLGREALGQGSDGPDLAALITALTAQTTAMADLVNELREERSARKAAEDRVSDLELALAGLTERLVRVEGRAAARVAPVRTGTAG